MKKLHFTCLALFVFFSTLVQAQTEKGNMLLGGTASFGGQFNDFQDIIAVGINPQIGFFLEDNLAFGGALNLGYASFGGGTSATSFGVVPFARYYFGSSSSRFFIQAKGGFSTRRIDDGFAITTDTRGLFGGGPGMAFFLSEQIAIEGLVDLTRVTGRLGYTDLGLLIGVQAYLGRGN